MRFLILSDANIDFLKKNIWWKSYAIEETLFTSKRIKLVGEKKIIVATLDPDYETFIINVAILDSLKNDQKNNVYPSHKA